MAGVEHKYNENWVSYAIQSGAVKDVQQLVDKLGVDPLGELTGIQKSNSQWVMDKMREISNIGNDFIKRDITGAVARIVEERKEKFGA